MKILQHKGKALAGAGGLVLGGPVGALLGVALGHFYDRRQARYAKALRAVEAAYADITQQPAPASAATQTAFHIGVIALGARLAQFNRNLTPEKLEHFRRIFGLPQAQLPLLQKMFQQALFDGVGHQPYAQNLAKLFAAQPEKLQALLAGLVKFARLDGAVLTPQMQDYISSLGAQFGLPAASVTQLLQDYNPKTASPYEVLGVTPSAPATVVRAKYMALVKHHHPDALLANAGSAAPQDLAAANDRVASLNAAYDAIRTARGW